MRKKEGGKIVEGVEIEGSVKKGVKVGKWDKEEGGIWEKN